MPPIYNLSGGNATGMDPAAFLNALQTAAKWGSGPGQVTPFDLGVNATTGDVSRIGALAQAERDSERRSQAAEWARQAQMYAANQALQGHALQNDTAYQLAMAKLQAALAGRQTTQDIASQKNQMELAKQGLHNQGLVDYGKVVAAGRSSKPTPVPFQQLMPLLQQLKNPKGKPEDNALALAVLKMQGYNVDPMIELVRNLGIPKQAGNGSNGASSWFPQAEAAASAPNDSSQAWQAPGSGQAWSGSDWRNYLSNLFPEAAPSMPDPYSYAKGPDSW